MPPRPRTANFKTMNVVKLPATHPYPGCCVQIEGVSEASPGSL